MGFFLDLIANLLAGWLDSLLTPYGMTGIAVAIAVTVAFVIYWHRQQRAAKKPGMASWQFIALCFVIALAATGAGGYGLGLRFADHKQAQIANAIQPTITEPTESAFGFAPTPRSTTVQWKDIFGTSRAVDLVFALFLDGRGPASKSVKLKDAYLQSGITGQIIKMQIGGTNPLAATFPISEANPIPPNGFIRLVAVMNAATPFQGIANKDFYDVWKKTWFHAIYEDDNPDDIPFDEKVMGSYFPEISGPHVTRKSDASPEPFNPTDAPQLPSGPNPKYSEYWLNELKASAEEARKAFCSDWPIAGETRATITEKAERFSRAAKQFADDPRVKQHIADASEPLGAFEITYGEIIRTGAISDIDRPYYDKSRKIMNENFSEIEKAIPFLSREQER